MRAENWQDVEEKERARALHRLSKFFAIPKVSDRKRERAEENNKSPNGLDGFARHNLTSSITHLFQDFLSLDDISKTDIYEMLRSSVKRGPNHLTPIHSRKLGRLSFVVRIHI